MSDYVLIVEDDRDLADAMGMILESQGFATEIAGNGREALEAVARQMPGLIILDMMMPVMNGWEFCRELDATYGRGAPILVVSAAENARARGREVGATDVLAKPFEPTKLIERVKTLTRHAEERSG